jgi:hypothetical protein
MRKTLNWIARTGMLLPLFLFAPALAESEKPLTPELLDMENVLSVISKVNIRQVEGKTNQAVSEILEEKSQMYQPSFWLAQQKKTRTGPQLATFGNKRMPSRQP